MTPMRTSVVVLAILMCGGCGQSTPEKIRDAPATVQSSTLNVSLKDGFLKNFAFTLPDGTVIRLTRKELIDRLTNPGIVQRSYGRGSSNVIGGGNVTITCGGEEPGDKKR